MAAVVPKSDNGFAKQVAVAQHDLAESIARAGLQKDPYRHVHEALSAALGTFPELVAHLEATRLPVRDEDMRRAVIQGISGHASASVRALGWRNVLIAAGMLFAVALVSATGGYWFGRTTEAAKYVNVAANLNAALAAPEAAEWLNLIRQNNIKQVNRTCEPQAGGVACTIAFWTKAPPAQ